MNRTEFVAGPLAERANAAIDEARASKVVERIWNNDASLWKSDEAATRIINNSLGWLTVAGAMLEVVDKLNEFAESTRKRFRHVMVCGMGGSSLCPEVLAKTFGQQQGFPELLVLDSTDPDVIASLAEKIDIERCLFVIASKSGSTTEPNVFYKYWYEELGKRRENPGENFIAITDPGSPLVDTATELKFQKTFLNQADIGGRYSALSYFGMLPAALMGLDVGRLLIGAQEAARACQSPDNAALRLGVIVGELANAGRDKLTLVLDQPLATLGLWIEQLIAESSGKEGRGILPVTGELLDRPDVYANDRVFVSISLGQASAETKSRLEILANANHPIIRRELTDVYDLGAEFFDWEFATACAGWRMGINPFDQPNVQEAKDATKELLNSFARRGRLEERTELADDDVITVYGVEKHETRSVAEVLKEHLSTLKPGDYIAFLNYIEETHEIDAKFQQLRRALRNETKCAVTIGYGPRFLHSTGQLHKGGPDSGVFFQIIADDASDLPIPGEEYTFSILKQAQAFGDFRALAERDRRVIGIEFKTGIISGWDHFQGMVLAAIRSERFNEQST